ncbi:MAG TPA: hypothetical protein GXZ59_04265 [Clostridiaceae bacterium]|nr:hypothetical protein [Clostridiaceae bacterium]
MMDSGQKLAKLKSYIGLARRANKLACGQDRSLEALLSRQAVLLLISEDCGAAAARQLKGKAKTASVPVLMVGTREEIGQAVGIPACSAVAVMDEGFAQLIKKVCNREQVED